MPTPVLSPARTTADPRVPGAVYLDDDRALRVVTVHTGPDAANVTGRRGATQAFTVEHLATGHQFVTVEPWTNRCSLLSR